MENRVCLVTGSSSGIGYEIAKSLAKRGCNIVIHYNSNLEAAKKLESEIKKYKVETLTIKCDLENENEIYSMVDTIIDKFKKIDYLVNNAAVAIDTTMDDKTKDNFNKILNVNLVGTFILSKKVAEIMYKNKFGKIINISSTNGIDTYYTESLDYDASKAGLISLTHNLSKYYAPYVIVNAVCPGWVNTPMNKNLDKEFIENENKKIYLNRFAEPSEIASLVEFLLLDASYINNSVIRIDGGLDHA